MICFGHTNLVPQYQMLGVLPEMNVLRLNSRPPRWNYDYPQPSITYSYIHKLSAIPTLQISLSPRHPSLNPITPRTRRGCRISRRSNRNSNRWWICIGRWRGRSRIRTRRTTRRRWEWRSARNYDLTAQIVSEVDCCLLVCGITGLENTAAD